LNTRNEETNAVFYFYSSLFCENSYLEYVYIHVIYRGNQAEYVIHSLVVAPQEYVNIYSTRRGLASTRYSFTPSLSCTSQSSVYCPTSSALLTLLQCYCTTRAQHTTPHPTPLVYTIHHTLLTMAISCKGQIVRLRNENSNRKRS